MTLVKICGITRRQDAHAAVEAGAHALGFIFVETSPRCIRPDDARSIIRDLPPFVVPVGVFVNTPRPGILDTIHRSGITCVQLHGEESPEDVAGFPVPVCKGFRVSTDFDPSVLKNYRANAFLLDAFVPGKHGGTGKTFDWDVAVAAKQFGRVVLSGGITPTNAGEAIRKVRPYALDVSSGVESEPGKKDPEKIRQLFEAIARADEVLLAAPSAPGLHPDIQRESLC